MPTQTVNTLTAELTKRKRIAEIGLISCVLADSAGTYESSSWVAPTLFSDSQLGRFWGAWLQNQGDLDKTILNADPQYQVVTMVSEQISTSFSTSTTRPDIYADRIQKLNFLTNVSRILQRASTQVSQEQIDQAITTLNEIMDGGYGLNDTLKSVDMIHDEFVAQLHQGWDGIATGFGKIDYTIGRLLNGHLSVVASRPSVGKTALAWTIACRVAADEKKEKKVLYFSTESSAIDLWIRRAAGIAEVNWRMIVAGAGKPEEVERIIQVSDELKTMYGNRLIIDDQHDTLADIQRMVAIHKPNLIIVDHLDEIQVDKGLTGRPNVEINKVVLLAESVRVLRRLGKQHNAHVMCIHQLNRALESREDHEPTLADLRWSGDIEQKADIIFLLHRPDLYDDSDKSLLTEVPVRVKIAKNRMGARDVTVNLTYNLSRQDFSEERQRLPY